MSTIVITDQITRQPTLREITRSSWSTSAPSSLLYHPSMKSPPETPLSGIVVGIVIIAIAILIGLIIWLFYLAFNR